MYKVVLLGFAHVLIITAVVTGSFVRILFHANFKFNFMLSICQMDTVVLTIGKLF